MCAARHDLRWLPLRIHWTRWNGTGMAGRMIVLADWIRRAWRPLFGDGSLPDFFLITGCCCCVSQCLRSLPGYGRVDSSPYGLITYVSRPSQSSLYAISSSVWIRRRGEHDFNCSFRFLAQQALISPCCIPCPDMCVLVQTHECHQGCWRRRSLGRSWVMCWLAGGHIGVMRPRPPIKAVWQIGS